MNSALSIEELHSRASILITSTSVIITLYCASSDGTFCNFSLTLNVKVNYARNYREIVRVMPKILVVPFFSGHNEVCSILETVYFVKPKSKQFE